MSISVLKSAFNREKPHSSISDLIDILTAPSQAEESLDNIPELIHSINLQVTGPAEVCRALRKKLKHGNSHQQYRALVILKVLIENTDPAYRKKYTDDHLIDALRTLTNPNTENKVRKKLTAIVASWNTEFKDDPSMSFVADLYRLCRAANRRSHTTNNSTDVNRMLQDAGLYSDVAEQKRREKEEKEVAKRKAKQEKAETKRRAGEEARRNKIRSRRPFNFEAERPQIINAIANASQASNNLDNAMKLVNLDKERIETNEQVQRCLEKAKAARKTVVRYTQHVENEDILGTLIATNEQVMAMIQKYDDVRAAGRSADPTTGIQSGMAAVTLSDEHSKLQGEPGQAEENDGFGNTERYVHPDLQDLSFGPLGHEQGTLPPPMRPSARRASSDEDAWDQGWGHLSDFSDYESGEEQPRSPGPSSSTTHQRGKLVDVEDPFADPFAD
ncbi:hypothetical protein J3A83DRAFT_4094264 [Scleroderma citrinum]